MRIRGRFCPMKYFMVPWFGVYSLLNYYDEQVYNTDTFLLNREMGTRFGNMFSLDGDHQRVLEN